jgi:hypothetical protein
MNNGSFAVGLAKRNIDMSMNMGMADALECTGMAQNLAFTDPDFLKRIQMRMQRVISKKP